MCQACGPLALFSPRSSTDWASPRWAPSHLSNGRVRPIGGLHRNRVADLVISGGPILAMDAARSRPESVAISGGMIAAVGSAEEIAAHVGPGTEMLDLDGRALLPGLIDPHMHAAMVQMADWVDVSPMTTPTGDDVMRALRNAAPASTGWVLANLFDPSITKGQAHLDRYVLDALSPDRPMLVFESNGHVAYANSAAMRTCSPG